MAQNDTSSYDKRLNITRSFRACNFSLRFQPTQKSLKVRESILLDFCTFVSTMDIPVSKHKTRIEEGIITREMVLPLVKAVQIFHAAKLS